MNYKTNIFVGMDIIKKQLLKFIVIFIFIEMNTETNDDNIGNLDNEEILSCDNLEYKKGYLRAIGTLRLFFNDIDYSKPKISERHSYLVGYDDGYFNGLKDFMNYFKSIMDKMESKKRLL